MLRSELEKLRADVADIKLRDFRLGNLLGDLVTHLAHAHGLDDTEVPASASEPAADASEDEDEDTPVATKTAKGKK